MAKTTKSGTKKTSGTRKTKGSRKTAYIPGGDSKDLLYEPSSLLPRTQLEEDLKFLKEEDKILECLNKLKNANRDNPISPETALSARGVFERERLYDKHLDVINLDDVHIIDSNKNFYNGRDINGMKINSFNKLPDEHIVIFASLMSDDTALRFGDDILTVLNNRIEELTSCNMVQIYYEANKDRDKVAEMVEQRVKKTEYLNFSADLIQSIIESVKIRKDKENEQSQMPDCM